MWLELRAPNFRSMLQHFDRLRAVFLLRAPSITLSQRPEQALPNGPFMAAISRRRVCWPRFQTARRANKFVDGPAANKCNVC